MKEGDGKENSSFAPTLLSPKKKNTGGEIWWRSAGVRSRQKQVSKTA